MDKFTDKTVFYSTYFPFYSEWIRDPAFLDMKSNMGYDGSGIFLELLCYLIDRPNYSARIDTIPTIARFLRITPAKLSKLINDYDLFRLQDGQFSSPWLANVMQRLDEQRAKSSAGGKKGMKNRWQKVDNQQNDSLPPYSPPNNSKGEDSKEEYSKGEDIIVEETKEKNLERENFQNWTLKEFEFEVYRVISNNPDLDNKFKYEEDVKTFIRHYNKVYPSGLLKFQSEDCWDTEAKLREWQIKD